MKMFDMKKLKDAREFSLMIASERIGEKLNFNVRLDELSDDEIDKFQLGLFVDNCYHCEFSVFLKPYDNKLFENVIDIIEKTEDNIIVPHMPIFKYYNKLGNLETTSVEVINFDDIVKAINDGEKVAIYKFENNNIIGKLLK